MNLASFTNFFSKHPRRRGPLMISEVDKTVDELAQAGIIGNVEKTNFGFSSSQGLATKDSSHCTKYRNVAFFTTAGCRITAVEIPRRSLGRPNCTSFLRPYAPAVYSLLVHCTVKPLSIVGLSESERRSVRTLLVTRGLSAQKARLPIFLRSRSPPGACLLASRPLVPRVGSLVSPIPPSR